MATNENLIPIPGRLHSVASEGHVAGADEIYDDTLQKLQSEINADVKVMGASGTNHSKGLVPDPGTTAGTTKYLREDGTWQEVSASPEVEIGETAPTEDVKLFVDEDADPAVTLDVYTRQQTDAMIADTVHLSSQTLTSEQKAQVLSNVGLESKQASSGGADLSMVTTGEKYTWNKVSNATDASGASDITSTFKYLLLNGTTGEFETALKSYVDESIRAALGPLMNNLNKAVADTKAIACIDNDNDLGTITPSNLASLLSGQIPELYAASSAAYSYDANNCVPTNNQHFQVFNCPVSTTNIPAQDGYMLSFKWNIANYVTQLFISANKISKREYTNTSTGSWHWTSWISVTLS